MGVSRSPAELARKLGALADGMGKLITDEALNEIGFVAKKEALQHLRRAVGADGRMSNNRRKMAVQYRTDTVAKTVTVKPLGRPWGILEFGARPHLISPRRNADWRRARRKAAKAQKSTSEMLDDLFALTAGGQPTGTPAWVAGKGGKIGLKAPSYAHPVTTPVLHPGVSGKKVWSRAVDSMERQWPEWARSAIYEPYAEHMRKVLR